MTATRHDRPVTRRAPVADRSSDRPVAVSKRSLVAVSHAIERAVLDGPITEPTVVVALFQRLDYFEREYAVYTRLAEAGVTVVIAFADGEVHPVPPGCVRVVLDPAEPLADEWSVIAVSPSAGAYLVATDAHRFDPTEYSLEAGREFTGRWGYSRVQAGNELARMRAALGTRLDRATSGTIDALLARVMPAGGAAATSAGTDGEIWATLSLHRMVQRMQDAREGSRLLRAQLADAHAAVSARSGAHTDPQSGLITPEFLTRWSDTGRPTALPVGVAVFDVAALDGDGHRHDSPGYDARALHHATRRVAAALTEPLGPVDAAVRLSEREFAVVVPAASTRHLRRLVAVVAEQLELSSDGFPHVPLRATVASTVTLARPLPLDDLHLALGSPDRPGTTLAGDVITVVSTDAISADPTDPPVVDPTEAFPRIRVDGRPTTDPDATQQGVPLFDGARPHDAPDDAVISLGYETYDGPDGPDTPPDGFAAVIREAADGPAPAPARGDAGAHDGDGAERDGAASYEGDSPYLAGTLRRADRTLSRLSGLPRRPRRDDGPAATSPVSGTPGGAAGPVWSTGGTVGGGVVGGPTA